MTRMSWIATTALVLLGAACGSSQPPPADPEPAPAKSTELAPTETAEPAPEYPLEVRESFMSECLTENDEPLCTCVLRKLEANVSLDDLSNENFEPEMLREWTQQCIDAAGGGE